MRIVAIRDIVSPIRSNIANAYIDFSQMTASVVAIETDLEVEGKPVIGYGFNSNGRYAQKGLLGERFIPRLKQAKPDSLLDAEGLLDPTKCWAAMMANEKPGGHGERSVAVGVLDMALWDAVAKAKRVPLWKLLADRYNGGQYDDKAWVYAAGGYYYPGKDLDGLQDEMKHYLDLGYSCVKMKVGGVPLGEDIKPIEGFGLRWYEEPLDPLDYLAHGALATQYAPPLATGENLFSMQDARNLVRHAGLRPDRDILQYDPALSYGLVEYLRTVDMLRAHGWSPRRCVPHGGHQFALNIAVGLQCGGNESYPQVFAPFGGFADDCPVVDGRVAMPDAPGIGFERKADLWAVMKGV